MKINYKIVLQNLIFDGIPKLIIVALLMACVFHILEDSKDVNWILIEILWFYLSFWVASSVLLKNNAISIDNKGGSK